MIYWRYWGLENSPLAQGAALLQIWAATPGGPNNALRSPNLVMNPQPSACDVSTCNAGIATLLIMTIADSPAARNHSSLLWVIDRRGMGDGQNDSRR